MVSLELGKLELEPSVQDFKLKFCSKAHKIDSNKSTRLINTRLCAHINTSQLCNARVDDSNTNSVVSVVSAVREELSDSRTGPAKV